MKLLPVLLGGDLNCYSMALAFYEAGVPCSVALGRYRLGVTSFSRVVSAYPTPEMGSEEGRHRSIRRIAREHPDKRPILIGCTDEYASFLIRDALTFDERFVVPSPSPNALKYANKAVFANACMRYGIATPEAVVLHEGDCVPNDLPFSYPIVLKPSVSEEYWRHPFQGMKKVWFLQDRWEAIKVYERIRRAGYCGSILLQKRLPIEDSDNYVLTTYSDRYGHACAAAYGRVLLEEHTARGLGNHAAILTEKMPDICFKILAFLDDIGYRGFANFDLIRDPESGKMYTSSAWNEVIDN